MDIKIKLTSNQVELAQKAIEKVTDFFNRQIEEDIIDELPELPVIRDDELYLPNDIDVIWGVIHSVDPYGSGITNKIDRELEGETALAIRAIMKTFREET